ncbi:response regulator transcription factor [Enterobacteriaceae bacterium YMB-R22]|jgi:DNA-binding NarL/FixJ family response regulator|uniref:response regulator transcription factor n=1 Tax=Tenebrionicola larvae TaxID=2815733 RepID=UPI002011E006|nr:LuxR C-terminal-related transcriptional regulator [Tenebrionicola larvae]MBV4414053.1 response regulator transcription factor [Tenebrionicola larvae]
MNILYLCVGSLSSNGIFYMLKTCFPNDEITLANIQDNTTELLKNKFDIIILDCESIVTYINTLIGMFSASDTPVLALAVDKSLLRKLHNELPGLHGMINRNGNTDFLIKAISVIAEGGYCYSWNIFDYSNVSCNGLSEDMYEKAGLTRREREILQFCLAGETNKSISLRLSRSEKTISAHKSNILRKLGMKGWQLKAP